MKKFMDEDFLLQSDAAKRLYAAVKALPIIDWHCHLDPREIAEDKTFTNLTALWLGGDHYKWRAMRASGVDEKYITGDAGDYEKFEQWARTIENCIGNPLYHWTHLELQRVFDCDVPLSKKTAKQVWEHCNAVLEKGLKVSEIIKKFNVELICTSDNPIDSLEFHGGMVRPTFRPSDLLNIESAAWADYIAKLSDLTKIKITDSESLKAAVFARLDFFNAKGCNMSDHALDPPVYVPSDIAELDKIIGRGLRSETLSVSEAGAFKTEMLIALGKKYHELGWSMQLHMGAARGVNSRMTEILGADKGYDCMSGEDYGNALMKLLDRLEAENALPRTFLFCLNPKDNDLLTTIAGCFRRVQLGAGWWFNDHKDGMELQMRAFANNGVLSTFAGMLTDSRSFLSYTRHEYFRRILCNLVGNWAENGEYPADFEKLEEIVKNISYYNAKEYFC